MAGEHMKPWYLAMNPMHNIPTIKVEKIKKTVLQSHVILLLQDGDFVMNESRAAAAYLVNKFAQDDSLYPKVTLFSVRIKLQPCAICAMC